MDLPSLGWGGFFERAFAPHAAAGLVPARVALEHKHAYALLAAEGEFSGELVGRLLQGFSRAELPAVGDWVAAELRPEARRASIHAVLPRRTRFSRRAPGERDEEQVVAANIDTVFLVCGLDGDFNPRRVERYLALSRGSGAASVVVLNKADLATAAGAQVAQMQAVAGEVPVHAISAVRGDGVEALMPYLGPGVTVALLGSSGAGKSTLANRLLGADRQAVGAVRTHDERGRHTTARRELFVLPGGGLLIDTPGMRELQLWSSAREGLAAVFPEVVELAASCRFRDCRHETEPGCGVRAALAAGTLAPERWASFLKLRGELEAHEAGGPAGERRARGPRVTGRRIMRG